MWDVGLRAVQFFADVHILFNRYTQQSFETFRKLLVYVPTDTGSFALQIFFFRHKNKTAADNHNNNAANNNAANNNATCRKTATHPKMTTQPKAMPRLKVTMQPNSTK